MNRDDSKHEAALANRSFDAIEIFISMLIQSASSIPQIGAPLSILGAGALTMHQSQNSKKFERHFKAAIAQLDKEKLDFEFLKTDEFKDLLLQVCEATRKTASDEKLNALANILCGCFTKPGSTFINKEAMVRIVSDMSTEEMKALYVIRAGEEKLDLSKAHQIFVEEVAKALAWSTTDTLIACQGLQQLNLVEDLSFDGGEFDENQKIIPGRKGFTTTNLAARIVLLARSGQFEESAENS